ncbi:MAG: phosphatidate cytidylyltransferase [Pseudomonadota bacterium]
MNTAIAAAVLEVLSLNQRVELDPVHPAKFSLKACFPNVLYSEFYVRLFFGLVMASITLITIYLSVYTYAVLIFVLGVWMIWEWSRLVYQKWNSRILILQMLGYFVVTMCAVLQHYNAALYIMLLIALLSYVFSLLGHYGQKTALWSGAGIFYVSFPTLSLIWFRHDLSLGVQALFYLMLIVWLTDSMAYLVGKNIGGWKLWPSISPNKTWSGFCGGLIASGLVGALWGGYLQYPNILALICLSFVLSLTTQIGDMLESAMKRNFGFKDSSLLIPGHGGILDRVDGLVFAACMAAILALWSDTSQPGAALLMIGS